MSWYWIARLHAPATDADAQAAAHEADGRQAGWLAAWRRRAKPVRHTRRVDARVVDRCGAAAWISLVLPPPGVRLPFDDPAVQHARRVVLARPPQDAVSTLLRDASHFEGAITVARGDRVPGLVDDPFARIFPARILRLGPGLFGAVAPPVGPTIERYGSAQPWPWDVYPDRTP
jgi:hypothetical protein